MKNFATISLLIAVVFALATCDDKGNDPDPCACQTAYGTTAHLAIDETCPCAGKDCTCTEQFAYVDTGNTIKIRKES
jgi:hypothetical protein